MMSQNVNQLRKESEKCLVTHEKFKDFIGYKAKVEEAKKEAELELSRSLSKGRQVQGKSQTPKKNHEISQERRVNSAQEMNLSGRGQPAHQLSMSFKMTQPLEMVPKEGDILQ